MLLFCLWSTFLFSFSSSLCVYCNWVNYTLIELNWIEWIKEKRNLIEFFLFLLFFVYKCVFAPFHVHAVNIVMFWDCLRLGNSNRKLGIENRENVNEIRAWISKLRYISSETLTVSLNRGFLSLVCCFVFVIQFGMLIKIENTHN